MEIRNLSNKAVQKVRDTIRLTGLASRFVITNPREALLLLRMAGWVVLISALVKIQPLPRVLSLATPRKVLSRGSVSNDRLAQLLDLLLETDIFVFTPTCWKRAAVLYRYLALNGTRTQIVFGVRKEDGGILNGHAWLEKARQPILEKNPPDYRITYSFPA